MLREPRTTKSFRVAGDRIVRQVSATSPSISGLLGAPAVSVRRATTDSEAWDVRRAALATLAQYDGLTFVTRDSTESSSAYNLVGDVTSELAIRGAVDEAADSAKTVQLRTNVRLADGRMSSAALVTPLAPSEMFAAALVALRGPPSSLPSATTRVTRPAHCWPARLGCCRPGCPFRRFGAPSPAP